MNKMPELSDCRKNFTYFLTLLHKDSAVAKTGVSDSGIFSDILLNPIIYGINEIKYLVRIAPVTTHQVTSWLI